jgi:hypothetical protein
VWIPVLWNIISETVAKRDSWDVANDGKWPMTLKCTIANASKSERDAQDAHTKLRLLRVKSKKLNKILTLWM